ncbi:hypothetical protein [Dyadobacter sandarakinus]|uniref:Type VI secretion, VasB, ImpH, VC_A0111 n=1 Tax=Dyadobacter sandarakinus TaxID=2747268 RepID=A0ABX7IDP5_9BACT|nr:hypothetical protein [Dyadobacter sandarakinus]QRR03021.1 hypothetical protein HWI92_19965 [Dyadobacter sandarakinus]
MESNDQTDLTAEFIGAGWLDQGISQDKFVLQALGPFRRRSHPDVAGVRQLEIGHFSGPVIRANRSGLYDYLPEQLFHLPSSREINTLKKKVDEIRLQRAKEEKSRLFFLPFEQEFFRHCTMLEQIEQRAMELAGDTRLVAVLRKFWEVPEAISTETLVSLLPLLAGIHVHRGNVQVAASTLTLVLGHEVEITEKWDEPVFTDSPAVLADALLGINLLLGGEVRPDVPQLSVTVHLPDVLTLEEWLHEPAREQTARWLLGWFVPAEYDFNVEYTLPAGEAQLVLENTASGASRLGYSVLSMQ